MVYLQNLATIIDSYDIYLVDQWGVLHNGVQPFLLALEAMAQLKKNRKDGYYSFQFQPASEIHCGFFTKIAFH